MLPDDCSIQFNEVAVAALRDVVGQFQRQGRIGPDWDHLHLRHTTAQRFTEEGDLIECEVEGHLTLCPSWQCGELGDNRIQDWNRWKHGKRIAALDDIEVKQGGELRSDEEIAAVSVSGLCPQARIAKLPEGRNPDFEVVLPDGRRAIAEVTMHTDGARRAVLRKSKRYACPDLANDWHIALLDNRFVGAYDGGNSFHVNSIQRTLAAELALAEVEQPDLNDHERIGKRCEDKISRAWTWERNGLNDTDPPLTVLIVGRSPAQNSEGGVVLSVAPSTFNLRQVVDTTGLISAVRQETASKLEKNQWGDTDAMKWLLIVLDDSRAATDLKDAFEFNDHQHDFTGAVPPGLDEVWVIAFDDGKLTVLRVVGSDWEYHPALPIPAKAMPGTSEAHWSWSSV